MLLEPIAAAACAEHFMMDKDKGAGAVRDHFTHHETVILSIER